MKQPTQNLSLLLHQHPLLFLKKSLLLAISFLFFVSALLAQEKQHDPSLFVLQFLRWYLPTVCGESRDFLKEPRLAEFILPEVLREWQKEAEQYEGLRAIPFIGNDYSDSWQTSFIVGPAIIEGNTARVPVVYIDPQWTQSYTMICEMVEGRWWIKDQQNLITGID